MVILLKGLLVLLELFVIAQIKSVAICLFIVQIHEIATSQKVTRNDALE